MLNKSYSKCKAYTHFFFKQMCCGNFLSKDELQTTEVFQGSTSQVALGGKDGSIFIMNNFQVSSKLCPQILKLFRDGSNHVVFCW